MLRGQLHHTKPRFARVGDTRTELQSCRRLPIEVYRQTFGPIPSPGTTHAATPLANPRFRTLCTRCLRASLWFPHVLRDLRAYCNRFFQPRLHKVTSVPHSPAAQRFRRDHHADVGELLLEACQVCADHRRISIGQGASQVLDLSLDLRPSPAIRRSFALRILTKKLHLSACLRDIVSFCLNRGSCFGPFTVSRQLLIHARYLVAGVT